MATSDTSTRRRVKLYALNADRQWDDRGTGHVTSSYVERLKGTSLLVRAENDGSLLLESKIQPDTAYQKQQDTLIVWSEGDNFDLALSFQEKAGCDEIWEKICHVQGKDPSVEITQDIVEESEDERFEEMSDSAPPIELPPCEIARLEDIAEVISSGLTSPIRKEKLAMAIESENFIKKLLNLFHICEDLENLDGLHHLYDIFKNIFLLNKNALFEIMFAEDTIFDVVGCLEYDPSGNPPKRHRQYLKQLAKFREAIPIKNPDLLAKIHQTYRVQYIQDIVLPTPSVFEDNMINTLSSFIFFNRVEIVTLIQEDEKFLDELFTLLTDPATSDNKRRDIMLFLKEFCNFAQYLQPHGKETFYKTLIRLGILPALEITLPMNDQKTKSASIDILTTIVEYSPSIVRDYTLQQYNNADSDDQTLINVAIEQMLGDSEPELGGAVQLMGVLRILLDPENMLSSINKSEKTDFLNCFYKHSINTLVAPLLQNTVNDRPVNEDYHTVQLLGLVLELLSFCVEHHTYQIKNCILNKDLLRRVLVLMKSTHTFLVLGALRFLRRIIALKDEFYNRHIVKGNLFAPVVDAFIRNNGRYNLLESAILELFEFIKMEDIKSLCTYVVENFGKVFDDIQYVQTFKNLRNKYDQHQDRLKDKDKTGLDGSSTLILRNANRFRRDARQLEEEEEIWFNEEDEFAETQSPAPLLPARELQEQAGLRRLAEINGGSKLVTLTTVSSSSPQSTPAVQIQYQSSANATTTTTTPSNATTNSSASSPPASSSSSSASPTASASPQNFSQNSSANAAATATTEATPTPIVAATSDSGAEVPPPAEKSLDAAGGSDDASLVGNPVGALSSVINSIGGGSGSNSTSSSSSSSEDDKQSQTSSSDEETSKDGSSTPVGEESPNTTSDVEGAVATSATVAATSAALPATETLSATVAASGNGVAPTTVKKGLVDYEADSDEEEEADGSGGSDDNLPAQKKQRTE